MDAGVESLNLQGHKEVSELLITKSADVNAVASSGYVASPCTLHIPSAVAQLYPLLRVLVARFS
jgi:hypothetical protein